MKKIVLVLLLVLFFQTDQISAQITSDSTELSRYGILLQNPTNLRDTGSLLFVPFADPDHPLVQHTHLYLLRPDAPNLQILGDTAAFFRAYDFKASPDFAYLAVTFVGEGHPWIKVYDLNILLHNKTKTPVAEINPYPGVIEITGWQGKLLTVRSDADLCLLQSSTAIHTTEDLLPSPRLFYLDIEHGTCRAE